MNAEREGFQNDGWMRRLRKREEDKRDKENETRGIFGVDDCMGGKAKGMRESKGGGIMESTPQVIGQGSGVRVEDIEEREHRASDFYPPEW